MKAIWSNPNSKHNSKETKEKQRLSNLKNREKINCIYNSKEYKEKLSNTHKKLWADPNSSYNSQQRKDKISKRSKENWLKPEYVKKLQEGLKVKINKSENKLLNILEKYSYIFVGDFKKWIGNQNPDFINKENKKVIELFGDYWHGEEFRQKEGDFSTNKEHEQKRIKHYNNEGYECLVIWECELKDSNILIEKINKFIKEN